MSPALEERLRDVLGTALDARPDRVRATPLSGGACQDLFRVEAELFDGRGSSAQRFALRSDARTALPDSLTRRTEIRVVEAARRAGVQTPRPFGLTESLVRPGASAYLMDWIDGEAIGAKVLRDPTLESARAGLPEALAAQLAAIHRVTPASEPTLRITPRDEAAKADPIGATLDAQREALDRLERPRPALEWALAWLARNRPALTEVTLVHGDFRTGNFLVSPRGLEAIVDWEFAHFGHPLEDVGWLCVRDWRFGRLDRPAGGLATRERFYRAYASASRRTVDPAHVHFFEVLGNVRWALGAIVQGLRYLEHEESDLELIAIGRRVQQMEYEALRLIEVGPPSMGPERLGG